MGNPRGQPEHAEIPVAVSEDNQPAKPPHTATVSNMTEMERSQPRDTLLQLHKVLRKKNYVLVILKDKYYFKRKYLPMFTRERSGFRDRLIR